MPFLIAVYGAGEFPVRTRGELDALFGDREWLVPRRGGGEVTERQKPNGFFTSVREGKRGHVDVSAVLFYRFKWLEDTPCSLGAHLSQSLCTQTIKPGLISWSTPDGAMRESEVDKW